MHQHESDHLEDSGGGWGGWVLPCMYGITQLPVTWEGFAYRQDILEKLEQ